MEANADGSGFTLGGADLTVYYADFGGSFAPLTTLPADVSWGTWSTNGNVTSRVLTFGAEAPEGRYYVVATPHDQARWSRSGCPR